MQSDQSSIGPIAIEAGLADTNTALWSPWLRAIKMFCGALFFALFSIMIIEVFNRFYDVFDIRWSEELARSLLIWFVFIGFGLASGAGHNVKADLTGTIQEGVVRQLLDGLATMMTFVTLVALVIVGVQLTQITFNTRMVSLNVSTAVVTCAVPLGAALGLIILAARSARSGFGWIKLR